MHYVVHTLFHCLETRLEMVIDDWPKRKVIHKHDPVMKNEVMSEVKDSEDVKYHHPKDQQNKRYPFNYLPLFEY